MALSKAYCRKCRRLFEGRFVTTPSDDGRYTYTWGPACPRCGEEGKRPPTAKKSKQRPDVGLKEMSK